jgi:RNA polymerase sigma-70 factor (ECF subfamily)
VKAQADDEPEAAVAQAEAVNAALEVLGSLSPADRAALLSAINGDGETAASPAERKRRQRAWDRLRLAWRRSYGA